MNFGQSLEVSSSLTPLSRHYVASLVFISSSVAHPMSFGQSWQMYLGFSLQAPSQSVMQKERVALMALLVEH